MAIVRLLFSYQDAIPYTHFQIPCGQCIGCRLARSADAMVRCIHESKMWPVNTFVTLTYSEEFLPEDNGLCFRDLQLFWKRLRRYYDGRKIRYFACGEYGTLGHRPHYHAIIFNCDFADKNHFLKLRAALLLIVLTFLAIYGVSDIVLSVTALLSPPAT